MAEQHNQQQLRQIQDEDRISSLPCEILSQTLSFLPTKHAVLTSILSKRWERNWALVTNLDFNDELMFHPNNFPKDNRNCFSSFVERVLLFHSAPIKTFRLQCHLKYYSGQLFNWISYAVDHGVRELDFSCFYANGDDCRDEYVQLPQKLFTNQKLEVLKLRSSMTVQVPISVSLPNLRVLHMVKVAALSDSGIKNLICNCPRIEELVLIREHYDYLSDLAIISNSLKVLKYHEPHMDSDEDECNVVINAPKLEYFDLSHTLSRAFDISVLPSLVKASIDDVTDALEDSGAAIDIHNRVNLFTGISYVRHLSLSSSTMHNLGVVSGIAMPTFYYLTHLEVGIGADGWQILPKLLKCSPHLKHFVLHKGNSNDMSMPHLEVNCMSCLETIEMKGFDGSQVDMDAVKNFLENAMVLKKMKICTRKGVKVENVVIERFRRFQRGSKCCELRLGYN